MRFITFTTVNLFLLLCLAANALAQSRETKPTGSISGQVMLGEQPASGVTIALTQRRQITAINVPFIQTVTDSEGRFHLTNIAAGTYAVAPLVPGFVVPNENSSFGEGRSVNIDEGEAVDGVNFSIKRGGVITGRVTDENHEPIIETRLTLMRVTEQGPPQPVYVRNPFMSTTDDRGIYRIYGLPAGRYKVSIGELPDSSAIITSRGNPPYQRTFHPDVLDESKAEIIEVSEGGEAINVDISVNAKIKTYAVTGHIVHAVTGKPIRNVMYGYGAVMNQGPGGESYMGSSTSANNRTNSRGEFRIEGITPGSYAVFMVKEQGMDLYAAPEVFEIKVANVSGLEMKVQSGISINGVAVVEGATNAALRSALLQTYISAQISPRALEANSGSSKISIDGTFRLSGLRAGKARLSAYSMQDAKKFTLLRVEQNGVEVTDGIAIKEGDQITDVRLVLAYGTARIRGQVKVETGELPEGLGFMVMVGRKTGAEIRPQGMFTEVDRRGRFIIEDLIAGEYELTLQPRYYQRPKPGASMIRPLKQMVTVTDGAEVPINFIINPDEKKERQ
jgi:hypothetical protein